ncbi:MAG: phosphomannomutase [Candidatus Cloacimonas sp. 4484_209]|nr:MAG: phosphomannomutase [Candidatus Cloacimonas sp. 4484_209]
MSVNKDIFRTYDIRGIAETDLDNITVEQLGRAYGTFLPKEAKTIGIGRDIRLSSKRIRDKFVKGLLSTGKDVIDLGMIPTPILYFAVNKYELDGGVEITGSHNPKEYNGLKILKGKDTIYGDDIKELGRIAESSQFRKGKGTYLEKNPVKDYIDDISGRVSFGEKTLYIIFDAGNGTAGPIVRKLYEKLPFSFEILYEKPIGSFPNHLPDPTIPEYLDSLIKRVKKTKADFGVGFDGDGDRIGAIDEQGNIIWGDKLLAIFAKEVLLEHPQSKIICEVKCSNGLIEFVKKNGGIPIVWKTGHSLIKAKMKEENALLAGEMSGHMFFRDKYYGFDDAIYASLRLTQLLSKTDKKLSSLAREVPSYFATPEVRINCPDNKKFQVVKEVKNHFIKKNLPIIDVDGVRVSFTDGWGLLRASNTQPVLVLRFEANTEKALKRIKTTFLELLEKYSFIKL